LAVLLLASAVRLVNVRQPLVENFIDRQVHTAMMARNLARGGSVLYPEIDIGPFPAYYMLEFPGYPALAALAARLSGLPLDAAGRLVSIAATAVACVLLYALVRRRDGAAVACVAAAMLALMPVTVRYGRAFQPDATMLALLVAGVWAMDRWTERGERRYLALAALATAAALLLKVIAAYVLLPLAYLAWHRCGRGVLRRWDQWLALAVAVLPSLAWYVHAWHVAAGTTTVSTPFWHAHKWIALDRLADLSTYRQLAYFIGLRVVTPVGLVLAVAGALLRASDASHSGARAPLSPPGRGAGGEGLRRTGAAPVAPLLFHAWLGSLLTYFPILVRKLDHEHYYLALAPVASVFAARALCALAAAPMGARFYVTGSMAAFGLGAGLLATNLLASVSTFLVPSEWRHVTAAAAAARECTPPDALVAAHSSVLFYADRRGFTVAYEPHEVGYLLSTWGRPSGDATPTELLDFYRERGAAYFVELLGTSRERNNRAFFEHVRAHYRVVREEPGQFLIVSLGD
jgi:4-amino-4-deoxy-L-arabinose transferase-like glycosyltransferase